MKLDAVLVRVIYRTINILTYVLEGYAKKTELTFYFIASLLIKIMLSPLCVLKEGTLRILKW